MSLAHNMLNLQSKSMLPVIRQNEAAECGLASLAMVLNYFGRKIDLATIRRKSSVSLQGLSLRSLLDLSSKFGLSARAVKAPLEKLGNLKTPAILHWNMNHYVVLKKVSSNAVVVHDPALGERKYTFGEASRHYTGIAIEFTTTDTFERKAETSSIRFTDLWSKIFGLKTNLAKVLTLTLILQIFVLAIPFYLQVVVDNVLINFDTDLLLVLALGFGAFTLVNFVATLLRGYIVLYFGSMLSFQIASNVFRHLLRLPIDFFEKRHIGDVVMRFGSLEPIKEMLSEGLIEGFIDGLMAITTMIVMFIYSPKLAMVVLCTFVIYLLVRLLLYKPYRVAQENLIVAQGQQSTTFMESVKGITSIKLFASEEEREGKWQNTYANEINEYAHLTKYKVWFSGFQTGLSGFELIVVVYLAALMVIDGVMSTGMLLAFMAYKRHFSEKSVNLVEKLIELKMINLHLERVSDIVLSEAEVVSSDSKIENKTPVRGNISVQGLSFRYSDDSPFILRDISLNINQGETVAIIGASGQGKSTLFKVLTGLLAPTEGVVKVDGISLNKFGFKNYRQQIGVVMQDDDLLSGSIADNISFFDTETSFYDIEKAAQIACIDKEIELMPMRYESLIGDMGAALSGGQKQRIMLARALYKRPSVLFMDEGTAHLDIATEKEVNRSVSNLGLTRILIAHRPETIKSADRVLLLKNGSLFEVNRFRKTKSNQRSQSDKSINCRPNNGKSTIKSETVGGSSGMVAPTF